MVDNAVTEGRSAADGIRTSQVPEISHAVAKDADHRRQHCTLAYKKPGIEERMKRSYLMDRWPERCFRSWRSHRLGEDGMIMPNVHGW